MSLNHSASESRSSNTQAHVPTERELVKIFREAPHRFLDIGHSRVAYWRFGSGPDVVFVHGWPLDAATFRFLVPLLAPHFTCHLIDLPGVGQSESDPDAPIDFVSHAASLESIVDAIGLTRYALLAHDSGGFVARLTAADDSRVTRIVLGNSEIPGHTPPLVAAIALLVRLPFGEKVLRTLLRSRAFRHSALGLGGCFEDPAFLDGDFHELFIRPLLDDDRVAKAQLHLLASLHGGMMERLAEAHRKIRVPVALLWGTDDPFFPIGRARKMVSQFGGPVTFAEIKGGKVFAHEDHAAEFAALAERFLGAEESRA